MVPICRSAPFLLTTDVVKALPSRKPETKAAQNATAMMGHPTRQIQQGPIGCPSCGHAHRAGTVCSVMKASDNDFLDDIGINKGVLTISGQKRGNPYRDEGTGRFAASPQGGAGGAAGGGAMGGGEPTQENTVMGARPKAPAAGDNIGTANTMEAPAPSLGGGATEPAAPAGGNSTMPGKQAPKNMPGITPSMIARHEKEQADDQGFLDKLLAKPQPEPSSGPKNVFSHEGAQNAYSAAKDQAMGGGASPDQAHAAGMKAGGQVYADSIRDPNAAPASPAQAPSAHGPQQSPPTRSAPNVMPGARSTSMPTTPGGPATAVSPAPTMPGAPAPAAPGGGAATPAAPGIPSAPAAPGGGAGAAAPKTPKVAGAGGKKGNVLDDLIKPWAHAAGGMGAGLFTPGGTLGATSAALNGTAHGLLHHASGDNKPASAQHQQKVQGASKQSNFLSNQNTKHLNGMRQFAGQAGGGGSGMPGGTP